MQIFRCGKKNTLHVFLLLLKLWSLVSTVSHGTMTGNYSCLVAQFHLKRSISFHLIQVISLSLSYHPGDNTFTFILSRWQQFLFHLIQLTSLKDFTRAACPSSLLLLIIQLGINFRTICPPSLSLLSPGSPSGWILNLCLAGAFQITRNKPQANK